MIILTESEQIDILSYYPTYIVDEQEGERPDNESWVSRLFPSTGRMARIKQDGNHAIIKQVF